jgi:hypothetical protein
MEAGGLQRPGLAAGKIAPREIVQAGRGEIDRKLGTAQNDLGQLVELMRLLLVNDGLCREVSRQPERHRARKNERRKREVRSVQSHPVRQEFRKVLEIDPSQAALR